MITNAQEEPLVNGKQVILCTMNFSQARSKKQEAVILERT
jgi:hypothetical protein